MTTHALVTHNGEEAPKENDNHDEASGQSSENGDKQEEGSQKKRPPQPVGFWSPQLKHVRVESMSKWLLTTVILMAFILAVLSMYWAVLYHLPSNISSLVVYIVDFDGQAPFDNHPPIVGPAVRGVVDNTVLTSQPTLGYETHLPAEFNNDPMQVRQAVFDFKAWAAIIINPNATTMLYSAIETGNTSYDPTGACQLVYISSRDDTNWYDFMLPLLTTLQTQATTKVGEKWTRMVLQNASIDTTLLANLQHVPQALSPAIGFSMYDLRPFYPYTAIPATSIGLIYLIIMSFFSFSFYLPIHLKYLKPEGHAPLKFWQLIIWRWSATIVAYLFLSLAYSFVSLAFQINFAGGNSVTSETSVASTVNGNLNTDDYGRGTFPVYWMLNFIGMIALGLACENVAMVVGQPWTGLWLIFWVITNVSTSFYDIDLAPRFYYWGYAWPLHNIVEASRQILFGLHSRIGLNFGILFAWAAINTAVFPCACYYMRWKSQHHVKEYYA